MNKEKLKRKLDEVIDFDLDNVRREWDDDSIEMIEDMLGFKLPEDYRFYLKYYGNDYFKDDYFYTPSYPVFSSTKLEKYMADPLFGLYDGHNNLERAINRFKGVEYFPEELFPIGDGQGGNLVCMNKTDSKIYLWFHDEDVDNCVFLVDDSFEQFIMNFSYYEEEQSDIENVKMTLSADLDKALREAAKKYQK
jgi:SMI1 / KNR4 family.